jgi:hypothetical protein
MIDEREQRDRAWRTPHARCRRGPAWQPLRLHRLRIGAIRMRGGRPPGRKPRGEGAPHRSRWNRRRSLRDDALPMVSQSPHGTGLAVPCAAQSAPQRPGHTASMGKVLGGGSSINVMVWARGHQTRVDNSEPAHNICFRGSSATNRLTIAPADYGNELERSEPRQIFRG